MKISVLTPTYNDEVSIQETAESLLCQTYTDWEWIVVNDGSVDNTDEIMKNLVEQYHLEKKCIYIKQENGDQLNALLTGCSYITGEYVFVLHSDDLLPSEDFFERCITEMEKDSSIDGLFGDLMIINEHSDLTGIQRVKKYRKNDSELALMLLWLGRNIYADTAFHKTESFLGYIKENYLTWNMPFWVYYEKNPQMLNYKNVSFPILKYRIHEGNYINNEMGMHNVLNGELRTAVKLMHYYEIPNYKLQYIEYRLLNKIGFADLFHVKYKREETRKKDNVIDFIIKKRFPSYSDKIYFYSISQFYKNKKTRSLDMSQFDSNTKIYCGKDTRAFNRDLLNHTIDKNYIWFMNEMCKGFDRVSHYEHLGEENVKKLLQFFCIEEEVRL